ncbi:MAG: hypothetical protein V1872_13490 [bacterium]
MLNNNILYAVSRLKVTHKGPSEISLCGTGFWINNNNEVLLVTNRHMVDLSWIKDIENPGDYCLNELLAGVHGFDSTKKTFTPEYTFIPIATKDTTLKYSKNAANDLVVIPKIQPFLNPYKIWTIPLSSFATQLDFDDVLNVGDQIVMIGFPDTWYDAKNNLPILRGGYIAGNPKVDYSDALNRVRGNCLAIEPMFTSCKSNV